MTVWKEKGRNTYRYSFYFQKQRHTGSTGLTTQADAERFEHNLKEKLRRRAAGLELPGPEQTPPFSEWAAVYFAHASKTVTRPERIDDLLRVVLRFWGRRPSGKDPKNPPVEGEPYHDLRLGDAIANPEWVAKFEDWMDGRGVAGQTKNQYRSTVRQMYQLALQPRWRTKTHIQTNPMDGIFRDRPGQREVIITPEDMRRLLAHASYHVRLAIAIGALAPKLRLASVLDLQWGVHIDEQLKFITVHEHKTAARTRRPQVIPITAQLRRILEDARRRSSGRRGSHVVTYRSEPIKTIRGGIAGAAKAAGLPYGRFTDEGLTFHTLRHTAATLMAELDVSEHKRKAVMGHSHIGTTQKYTHLRPMHEVAPLELLSEELPIDDLVTQSWRRPSRKGPVRNRVQDGPTGTDSSEVEPNGSKRVTNRKKSA